jgi:hypothetical protein
MTPKFLRFQVNAGVWLGRKFVHLASHLCGLHAQSPRGSWVPVMTFCGCVLQAAENPELLFFFYHAQANITTNVMHWPLREFIRQPYVSTTG